MTRRTRNSASGGSESVLTTMVTADFSAHAAAPRALLAAQSWSNAGGRRRCALAAKQLSQVDLAARHSMSLRQAGGLSVNSPMNKELRMSRVRVSAFSVSLDGFGTGQAQSAEAPFGHAGERLHEWMFATR